MKQKCYKCLLIIITVKLFSSLAGIGHMERLATAFTCFLFLCAIHVVYVLRVGKKKENLTLLFKTTEKPRIPPPKCPDVWSRVRDKSESVSMTLILGYMRSGSSLTGDIVHCNHGNFYIFEPLHGLIELAIKRNKPVTFLNGTKRRISYKNTNVNGLMGDMVYKWFTCDFRNIDLQSLSNEFINIFTPEHSKYYNCLQISRNNSSLTKRVINCLHILEETCMQAETRALKTIRLPMSSVGTLLRKLPTLKVVHLIRDPRAILHSQLKAGLIKKVHFMNTARDTCKTIQSDIDDMKKVLLEHPGQVRRLVYENLATHPIIVSKRLYKFLNADFIEIVEKYVRYLTTGPAIRCDYCTRKGNSTFNAFKWMKDLTPRHSRIVDKYCSNIYKEVGYQLMSASDLKSKNSSWSPNTYQQHITL